MRKENMQQYKNKPNNTTGYYKITKLPRNTIIFKYQTTNNHTTCNNAQIHKNPGYHKYPKYNKIMHKILIILRIPRESIRYQK